jgi:hypothetical protein
VKPGRPTRLPEAALDHPVSVAAYTTGAGGGTAPDHRGALRRVLVVWLFAVLPLVVFVMLFTAAGTSSRGDYAFDFEPLWQGARDVVHGHDPYPSRALLETSSDRLGPSGIQDVFKFAYPAPAAALLAPFGWLPWHAAAALEVALLLVATVAAFWLLRVRDWRVYGVVAGTVVANGAIRLGTLTPLLLLLVAVAWRWRDRRWPCAGSLALAISLKLFLWPLVVWLLATRRWAAAALTTALSAALTAGAWALLGFDGFSRYPELVRRLTRVVDDRGYSLVALGVHAGLPHSAAQVLPYLGGAVLLALAFRAGRRGADGDLAALAVTLLAALALTPIVWNHYFLLLFAPLAVARPRLSPAWALPLLFWIVPTQENNGHLSRVVLGLLLAVAVTAVSCGVTLPARVTALRRWKPA